MASCLGLDHGWLCCLVGNGRPDPGPQNDLEIVSSGSYAGNNKLFSGFERDGRC